MTVEPFRRVLPMNIATVTEKGPYDTDATVFFEVAKRLNANHDIGGSNVRAAVARLLLSAVSALEANNQPDPAWSYHGSDRG